MYINITDVLGVYPSISMDYMSTRRPCQLVAKIQWSTRRHQLPLIGMLLSMLSDVIPGHNLVKLESVQTLCAPIHMQS